MSATSSHEKVRVLITSIDAGGGHKQLKDSLLRTLKNDPNLEVLEYHSKTKFFNLIHGLLVRFFPQLMVNMFKKESRKLEVSITKKLIILPERKPLLEAVRKANPDIIIATHFIQSIILILEKRKTNAKYKVISSITDFGEQKGQMHLHTPAEYYLVRDEKSKKHAEKFIKEDQLFVVGTTVSEEFSNVAKLSPKELSIKFNEFAKKHFEDRIDAKKNNVLVIGGSGWARKSLSLIHELSGTNDFNIFVSCGSDKKLIRRLKKLSNVFPFGFVSQNELAIIEAYVNVAVLSSIAPATIYELSEINKYPLFVHNFIAPQESPHIDILSDWGVGIYEPDDTKMMELIKEYIKDQKKYSQMLENARKIRLNEESKSLNNASLIKEVYSK